LNGFTTGIGLLLKNYWNTELDYFWKMESFLPENISQNKEIFAGISLSAQLDLLDDILLPKNGIVVRGKYENSSPEWGSAVNYHMYQGSGNIFFTRKHNTLRIAGYYHQGLNDLPKNLTTISNGSQTFVGMKEFRLQGKTLLFSRFEYRYKHKKDIFAHLILSWLITATSDDSHISAENILCPGVGIPSFRQKFDFHLK
jgi:outer membrane translocation and assembly module TamA